MAQTPFPYLPGDLSELFRDDVEVNGLGLDRGDTRDPGHDRAPSHGKGTEGLKQSRVPSYLCPQLQEQPGLDEWEGAKNDAKLPQTPGRRRHSMCMLVLQVR